mmetsp:Transcript_2427/g.4938  ORF Transcript_2427/g.4938 Transcript_2427/m.4938 type:complete len:211 (+) Transcript_2427:2-634(+)
MNEHSALNACCMKRICAGCHFAAQKRGIDDCPFCRTPLPDSDADMLAMTRARVAKKDPTAILSLGQKYFLGDLGLQKDMQKSMELWTEAAELGSLEALYCLGLAYMNGDLVQRDEAKAAEFYAKAAMQGHAQSRNNLGCYEGRKGNYDRAVKHLLISARMGHKSSVAAIKMMFTNGNATKEQYSDALKGYQEAVEETKSHDRDEAKRLGY